MGFSTESKSGTSGNDDGVEEPQEPQEPQDPQEPMSMWEILQDYRTISYKLGMLPQDIWHLTIPDLTEVINARGERHEEEVTLQRQILVEGNRLLASFVNLALFKPKELNKPLKRLVPSLFKPKRDNKKPEKTFDASHLGISLNAQER